MSDPAVHRPHPEAPARATRRAHEASGAWTGLSAERFEIVSRGDFVPGLLYRSDPAAGDPAPLLLLLGGTAEGMHDAALGFAAEWVEQGLAVATIDLPLQGERSSPKLSERLFRGLDDLGLGTPLDPETYVLVEEFARQATSDAIRTLDALLELPAIDERRVAFLGLGVGAMIGSYLLAYDQRLRAAALAFVRRGRNPGDLDPATHLARAKPGSIVIVSHEAAEPAESKAAEICFEAAPNPKEHLRVPGPADRLDAAAAERIWRLLAPILEL